MTVYAIRNLNTSSYGGATAGQCYDGDHFRGVVQAYDPDGQSINYQIKAGSELPYGATFNSATGVIEGTLTLDHIGGARRYVDDYTWTFWLTAFDGINYSDRQFSITVKHIPSDVIWLTGTNLGSFNERTAFTASVQAIAKDDLSSDGGIILDKATGHVPATVTYNLVSVTPSTNAFSLNTSTGIISGTIPDVPRTNTTWSLVIGASVVGAAGATRTFTITGANVNRAPYWTSSGSLGAYNENTAIIIQIVANDDDNDVLTYSVVAGALPAGLSLSSTGVITGTASPVTATTTYNFTVRANDGLASADSAFSLTINYTNRAPVWITGSGNLVTVYTGDQVNYQLSANDPDGQPITFSIVSGSLPSGVTMNSAGLINGSNNSAGTYNFTVAVSDGIVAVNRAFSITINNIPNAAPIWDTPSGSLGRYYSTRPVSIQLAGHDDGQPSGSSLTYTLAGGALFSGMSLSSTGLITGNMPTITLPAPTYTYTTANGNLVYDGNLTLRGSRWSMSGFSVKTGTEQNPSSGDGSFYLVMAVNNANPLSSYYAYCDKFAVAPNDYYTFQFGLYISQVDGTGQIISDIEWFDENQVSIGASAQDVIDVRTSADSSYSSGGQTRYYITTSRSKTVVSPSNAAYGRYRMRTNNLHITVGQSDYHFNQFMVSRHNSTQPFSDDATLGSSYNTVTMTPNYVDPTPYDQVCTFTVNLSDGALVVPRTFSITASGISSLVVQVTTSGTWTVPDGITSVMFSWIIGGGGAGGAGTQIGNGGGGGGGGAGGWIHYQEVACNSGDVFTFVIGAAGVAGSGSDYSGYPDGGGGGTTSVSRNGTLIISVSGGAGGKTSTNTGATFVVAAGGSGGAPNGENGNNGPVGSNDYASVSGGAGAAGPLSGSSGGQGGAAGGSTTGSGPSKGHVGVGYGSGGGGGGMTDRPTNVNLRYWQGGNGVSGFIEYMYPSGGSIGGSTAR